MHYRVFLLTCWRDEGASNAENQWFFRLEETRSKSKHGFGTVEALFDFLQATLEEDDLPREGPDP